jgi:hypothetical protein
VIATTLGSAIERSNDLRGYPLTVGKPEERHPGRVPFSAPWPRLEWRYGLALAILASIGRFSR